MRNLVQSLAVLRNVEAFQLMLARYPQRHEGLGADMFRRPPADWLRHATNRNHCAEVLLQGVLRFY